MRYLIYMVWLCIRVVDAAQVTTSVIVKVSMENGTTAMMTMWAALN
jgi:hypothetical protein